MNRIDEIKERVKFNKSGNRWQGFSHDMTDDAEHLLSSLEIANKALEYYAELYRNLYHNIEEGELYQHWLERQGLVAVEALKKMKGEEQMK